LEYAIQNNAATTRTLADEAWTINDEEMCERAIEDPDGPRAAIEALIDGLITKYESDAATTAALNAIKVFHLPRLIELIEETEGAAQ
jgi:hypothetical protein